MKKILLATTLLAASASFAYAEVTLSGDARMGVVYNKYGQEAYNFTSRARVKFSMSGETDSGLAFGASFRAGEGGTVVNIRDADGNGVGDPGFDASTAFFTPTGAGNGGLGSVFISGSFGKLEMGDVDSAAEAAVGNVDCIALTICGAEEIPKVGTGSSFDDPAVLYSYSTGGVTFYASLVDGESLDRDTVTGSPTEGQIIVVSNQESYGLGVKYSADTFNVGLAYETVDNTSQLSLGAGTTFSGVSLKGVVAQVSTDGDDVTEYAISAGYTFSDINFVVFYNSDDTDNDDNDAYGLGASYDLGGGAAFKAGVIEAGETQFDIGVDMSF